MNWVLFGLVGELETIKQILPNNISGRADSRQRIEVSLRHPHPQRGVLLAKSLPRRDLADGTHIVRRGGRIDLLLVTLHANGCRRETRADEFAQIELHKTRQKRTYTQPQQREIVVGMRGERIGDIAHQNDKRTHPQIERHRSPSRREAECTL